MIAPAAPAQTTADRNRQQWQEARQKRDKKKSERKAAEEAAPEVARSERSDDPAHRKKVVIIKVPDAMVDAWATQDDRWSREEWREWLELKLAAAKAVTAAEVMAWGKQDI